MLKRGERLMIAVSGGSDSMAMLRLFGMIQKAMDLRVVVVHANHGLRGRASLRDEQFVGSYCNKKDLQFISKKLSVLRFKKKNGLSLEEAARVCRYRFFAECGKRLGILKVATAHTLDDQSETILMRLIRGSGPKGLSAVLPVGKLSGVTVIRPLIRIQKHQLMELLRREKIPFRVDATNRDLNFLRNKIRHRLMPYLEREFNPQIKKGLVEFGEICALIYDFTHKRALSQFTRLKRKGRGRVSLPIQGVRGIHPALRSEMMFLALETLLHHRRSFSKVHMEALESLVYASNGAKCNLPQGITVKKTNGQLHFGLMV